MKIQEAIRIATHAGYTGEKLYTCAVLLNPLFWEHLGKALGWKKEILIYYSGYAKDDEGNTDGRLEEAYRIPEWHFYWHCFIDHLAEGKSMESFFEQILIF